MTEKPVPLVPGDDRSGAAPATPVAGPAVRPTARTAAPHAAPRVRVLNTDTSRIWLCALWNAQPEGTADPRS
ncbi:hypothetical protein GCM10018963_08320 [Saccharothrix longispora]